MEVEHLCREVVLEHFAKLNLPGKLFLNVSPECLPYPDMKHGETLDYIQQSGIRPERVIIELAESLPTYDYALLGKAVAHYRAMGFEIAIDDLGECFFSLRLTRLRDLSRLVAKADRRHLFNGFIIMFIDRRAGPCAPSAPFSLPADQGSFLDPRFECSGNRYLPGGTEAQLP